MSQGLPSRVGEFEVVGLLGQGGSGVVYDARWGHRAVALKVLHPTLVATAKEREQFLTEARRLSEIAHAGVVKVLTVGELEDGRPYLAMEKLDGETLSARLARGRLDSAVALRLFAQLADAVAALHARELVHRDLKPENIVLVSGPSGEHAVLLDFGIAKSLAEPASTTTSDGGVRGTPAYMAPERFFGSPASIATDIYELAVVLFAMLAGRLPWDDCGDPDVRLNPARLADAAPDLPPALDLEVARALSTRAANRPASARAFADAVRAAAGLEGAPVAVAASPSGRMTAEVRPTSPAAAPAWFDVAKKSTGSGGTGDLAVAPTVSARPARKRRSRAWIVALVVAVLGGGIAIALVATRGGSGEATSVSGTSAAIAATDPWTGSAGSGGSAVTPPPSERSLRRELSASLGHFPHDTRAVIGIVVDEVRQDPDLGPFILDDPRVKELGDLLDVTGCKVDFARVTDWGAVGVGAAQKQLDAIVSGRWQRDAIEACLGGASHADIQHLSQDGVPLTRLHGLDGDRWLGWLDDRTFYLTTRPGVDAAWMAARVHATDGPEGVVRQLAPDLDRDATAWAIADAAAVAGNDTLTIPPGHVIARGVLDSGLHADVRIRYADAATAKAALDTINQQIDNASSGLRTLGVLTTASQDDDVELHVNVGRFLLHSLSSK